MTLNRCLNVPILIVLIIFLTKSHSQKVSTKNEVVHEIINTLNNINSKNDQLKHLVEKFVNIIQSVDELQKSYCECVPFYLCYNGNLNKDGSTLLQPRTSFNPCTEIGEICCDPNLINSTIVPITKEKVSIKDCGYSSHIKVNFSYPLEDTVSKFGEFPWTVMILDDNFTYQCVGSLIHPKVVLTTSHCLKNGTVFTVRAGEWNTTTIDEPYGYQNRKVKLIVKHLKFNPDNLHYNVALLVLEIPFKLDANIRTICLADEVAYEAQTPSSICAASGWGTDVQYGLHRRVMKKIEFSLMSHGVCQSAFRSSRLGKQYKLHKSFMCGINEKQRDLCTGDGGGPLVCPIEVKPLRFQQVGITSWGITCDGDYPSAFTDISYVRNWIDAEFYVLKLDTRYYTP